MNKINRTCVSLKSNDYLSSNIKCTASQKDRFKNWITTGDYVEKIGLIQNDHYIAKFSKCSKIPLVSSQINNIQVVNICDTGAARSCLSNILAVYIWGKECLDNLDKSQCIRLKDVNDQFLTVLGTKIVDFQIGKSQFTHNFVVYCSENREILLGNDFFREKNIGISPNNGIFFEGPEKISQLGQLTDPIFGLFLTREITLAPKGQEIIRVNIKIGDNDPIRQNIQNICMIAHTEHLQPDVEYENLNIYFQYVHIDANFETEVLICNHSEEIIHFRACSLVGHCEPIKQVANITEIQGDPLSHCLFNTLNDVDGKTLSIKESRICIDLPENTPLNRDKINCHSMLADDLNKLYDLHDKYKAIFSIHDWDVGDHKGSEVHFEVQTGVSVHHQRFSRINPKIRERADEIISMLLDRNLIEISKSPWSSRLLFVEKAPEDRKILDNDGIPGQKLEGKPAKLRLVVDFRNVNSKLKQLNSNWPAPTIKDILNELHEAAYLSTLDVTQGFFSYPITESSKQYTAFTYGDTVLQFRRLPQGLSISSKIMQFKMKSFQFKHQLKGVTVYIDNILLFGPTKEIYEQRLEAFFKACVSEGIKLKPNKCHHYIHKKFIIFGFEVDLEKHTIAPEEAKVKKIRQLIAPNTKKKCKGFLGAVG